MKVTLLCIVLSVTLILNVHTANQKIIELQINHVWHLFECIKMGGAYICITCQILKMNVRGITPSL